MSYVIKRDGRKVSFNPEKIKTAILKAFKEVDGEISNYALEKADNIASYIENLSLAKELSIEDIQDLVEKGLMATKRKDVAKAYVIFRNNRDMARKNTIDDTIDEIIGKTNDYWLHENSNKDAALSTTQRDYIAGEVSTDASRRRLLPKDVIAAHDNGEIHFHDMDYYLQKIYNCCLINIEDMLQNGTVISKTQIDKPHKFSTACNVTTQIVAQVASSQYGGQSISLAHLAPFVNESRKTFKRKYPKFSNEDIELMVKNDIEAGVQTIQYQILTLMTTNGQTPFITVYMNLAEVEEGQLREDLAMIIQEVLKQRIKGVKNEKGVYITPAFPKLIYALDDINIYPNSKYFYLTQLSAECTAKRMVPDYISNKIERELKNGDIYPCMGCRSFLTPDRMDQNYANAKNYIKGNKYYGRFNQGVVTINLVDVALSSKKDKENFWKILNERLELCHKALRCRHDRLLGTSSNSAPILWQHGAIARLPKDTTIDELLYHGYSTISLGYAGLYECTKYMTGLSHTSEEGKAFALSVMQALDDACDKWKAEEDIDYSVYGTPLESTTYKFAKCLKKKFGKEWEELGEGYDYITNSYHINVREKIDAFSKLAKEAEFQKLSPGGAISYIEVPNMQHNIDAIISVIQFIYENIMYAEINTKSDYCQVCGYEGEIKLAGETNNLYWKCPQCGNTDTNKMNVARRTCGYIGTNFWNRGRTQEIHDRVLHL